MLGVLGIAALVALVVGRRHALIGSAAVLGHLRWIWIPPALGLEWLSFWAFSRMQWELLKTGGRDIPRRSMLATVYGANAVSTSVPLVGPELGAAFTFRRFKRQGVDPPLAGWALLVGGVVSPVSGTLVLMVGALLSGNDLFAVIGIVAGLVGMAFVAALHAATRSRRLRSTAEPLAAWILGQADRLHRHSPSDPRLRAREWGDRLALLRPSPSVWLRVGALGVGNWLTDAGVLAASIYAVGAVVPWHVLLLVYGSAVVIRSLGITPGGIGLVEGALCLGLVASGLHVRIALASVLLYRLISFWMPTLTGWAVLLHLHHRRRVVAPVVDTPPLAPACGSAGHVTPVPISPRERFGPGMPVSDDNQARWELSHAMPALALQGTESAAGTTVGSRMRGVPVGRLRGLSRDA